VDAGAIGVAAAAFLASGVEFVEALTIVLAMGFARSWRAALWGAAAAGIALTAVTVALGTAIGSYVPESALQLLVGTLLLVFGLQWLRKAELRSAGLKPLHDEEAAFRHEREAALAAGTETRAGLDWYAFVVSFKGVFLEGLEVVFIVLTFGASAGDIRLAAGAAGVAGLLVVAAGVALHRPLSTVPENTLKYSVGVLLCTFGLFWAVEGLGVFAPGGESLGWPGGDGALAVLLVAWIGGSRLLVHLLRGRLDRAAATA
jgi:uncharacterized membrane protein